MFQIILHVRTNHLLAFLCLLYGIKILCQGNPAAFCTRKSKTVYWRVLSKITFFSLISVPYLVLHCCASISDFPFSKPVAHHPHRGFSTSGIVTEAKLFSFCLHFTSLVQKQYFSQTVWDTHWVNALFLCTLKTNEWNTWRTVQ